MENNGSGDTLGDDWASNTARIAKIEASQRNLIADLDEFKETVDNGFQMLVAKIDALLQPAEDESDHQTN